MQSLEAHTSMHHNSLQDRCRWWCWHL